MQFAPVSRCGTTTVSTVQANSGVSGSTAFPRTVPGRPLKSVHLSPFLRLSMQATAPTRPSMSMRLNHVVVQPVRMKRSVRKRCAHALNLAFFSRPNGFGETATNTDPKDTADQPPSSAKGHPAPDHYHFQGHQAFLAGAGRQIPGDPRLMRIWLGLPGAATGISERIHAGAVVVNCHGRIDPLAGFSGGKGGLATSTRFICCLTAAPLPWSCEPAPGSATS